MGECYLCGQPSNGVMNGFKCCKGCSLELSRHEMKADEWKNSAICEIVEDTGLTQILQDSRLAMRTLKMLHLVYGKNGLDLKDEVYHAESDVLMPFFNSVRKNFPYETKMLVSTENLESYLSALRPPDL